LGDGIDDHPLRAALRRIETVGDDREFGDGIAAEARLLAVGLRVIVDRHLLAVDVGLRVPLAELRHAAAFVASCTRREPRQRHPVAAVERKSTRLNSSHQIISYAVFCLKKKKAILALAARELPCLPPIASRYPPD